MIVTKVEPVTKARFKVYLNEQFAFVLYKGELSRYKIQEECEVTQELVDQIKNEVSQESKAKSDVSFESQGPDGAGTV